MANRPDFLFKSTDDFEVIIQLMNSELEASIQLKSKKYNFDFDCGEPSSNPVVYKWQKLDNTDFSEFSATN